MTSSEADLAYRLNMSLFEKYFKQLSAFGTLHNLSSQDYLQTIIRIPNVVEALEEDITDEDWEFVMGLTKEAVDELDKFRVNEGKALYEDLSQRVKNIIDLLADIDPLEEQRKIDLQNRLKSMVDNFLSKENMDENRLEQEVVYYLEKLDIHEEKIRLLQHCNYFQQAIETDGYSSGKKLNFIAQEMGREINTLGAKAQYSPIQKIVVEMKVELDKIKEQLANVL